jgi:hypothetical protein
MSISVRTALASKVAKGARDFSIRKITDGLLLRPPITVRDILGVLEPIKLSFQLSAGICSCSSEITMISDGVVHYSGKVHDSGPLAASYVAITSIRVSLPPEFQSVVIAHKGHVGGTLSFDSRDDAWDLTAIDARIADNWVMVKAAAPSARTEFGINTGAIELIDAFVTGATGVWVFSL